MVIAFFHGRSPIAEMIVYYCLMRQGVLAPDGYLPCVADSSLLFCARRFCDLFTKSLAFHPALRVMKWYFLSIYSS
jgi:hypothetical protein